jgi:excisionase family DNA binding protein
MTAANARRPLLRLREIAKLLGVHYVTVVRWNLAGLLPRPVTVRRRHFFNADEIEDWLRVRLGDAATPAV